MSTILLSFAVILLALLGLGLGALIQGRSFQGGCDGSASCVNGSSCRASCRRRTSGLAQ